MWTTNLSTYTKLCISTINVDYQSQYLYQALYQYYQCGLPISVPTPSFVSVLSMWTTNLSTYTKLCISTINVDYQSQYLYQALYQYYQCGLPISVPIPSFVSVLSMCNTNLSTYTKLCISTVNVDYQSQYLYQALYQYCQCGLPISVPIPSFVSVLSMWTTNLSTYTKLCISTINVDYQSQYLHQALYQYCQCGLPISVPIPSFVSVLSMCNTNLSTYTKLCISTINVDYQSQYLYQALYQYCQCGLPISVPIPSFVSVLSMCNTNLSTYTKLCISTINVDYQSQYIYQALYQYYQCVIPISVPIPSFVSVLSMCSTNLSTYTKLCISTINVDYQSQYLYQALYQYCQCGLPISVPTPSFVSVLSMWTTNLSTYTKLCISTVNVDYQSQYLYQALYQYCQCGLPISVPIPSFVSVLSMWTTNLSTYTKLCISTVNVDYQSQYLHQALYQYCQCGLPISVPIPSFVSVLSMWTTNLSTYTKLCISTVNV
uniref:Uncharacterized protein LOC102802826 n=1 Tax=Saccoglossus kowalevskii TaxID=10224 RepID=A0ABM0MEQ3_SACKO|nr:PREDICTED: uncharacterized protein LOC102802826 [Saccoglossus kowalevskii]